MKRKYLSLLLVLVLVVAVFTGCSKQTATEEPTEGEATEDKLVDGFYLVKQPVSDHHNYPMATMEVKDGEIASFNYVEILAESGEEKNETNYQYPEGLAVIKDLNAQFGEKKDLEQVNYDAVSGATHTKESFKEVTGMLLEKAKNGEVHEPILKDGVYEAKLEEASHGWLPQIKIVVKNGVVIGVDYSEVAVEDTEGSKVVFGEDKKPVMGEDGKPKTEPVQVKAGDIKSKDNYPYLASIDTAQAFEKQVIDNNGTENVALDAVSGATHTRDNLINLANKALESAK